MDATSKQLFEELVARQAHELLETDIAFLKARESYLSAQHREKFGEVLGFTKPEKEESSKSKKKAE